MAFDEGLAHRIREMFEAQPGTSEKRMFGGLCFLLRDHMVAGIVGSELMVRVGVDAYEEALAHPDAREMDFTGRSMRGFVFVGEDGVAEDEDLRAWLERGLRHASSLPPKGTPATKPGRKPAKAKKQASKKKAARTKKQASKKKAARTKKQASKKKAARTKKQTSKKQASTNKKARSAARRRGT